MTQKIEDQEENKTKQSSFCLCKTLKSALLMSKLVGLFPSVLKHRDGTCYFARTKKGVVISIAVILLNVFIIYETNDFKNMFSHKLIPILLDDLTDCMYQVFYLLCLICNIYRSALWVKSLNNFSSIMRYNLPCQSSLKVIRKLHFALMGMYVLILVMHASILAYLHFSTSYTTNYNFSILKKLQHNLTFMFYVIFFISVSLFHSVLGCFESLCVNCLKYDAIEPMMAITNANKKENVGMFFKHDMCSHNHHPLSSLSNLPKSEIIQFLRILHEDILLIIGDANTCHNPLLLWLTTMEIIVLVIRWYSVIICIVFNFDSPLIDSILVLNLVFAILHTVGFFLFLKCGQRLTNKLKGLISFLLEYSTRCTTVEEHQQLRIFIEKIKQNKLFSAGGVFNIDLGIAGSVSANVLTYVLVALQFDLPKK